MSLALDGGQLSALFLVLMRCTGLVMAAPIFGHRGVPLPVKAGLAAALTIGIAPSAAVADGAAPLVLAAPLEVIVGLSLGFILALGFHAVETIGRLLSLQMGFSLSAVFSPTTNEGGSSLDPFFSVLAGVLFLALDLHLATIQTLAHSFQTFPLGGAWSTDLWQLGAHVTGLSLELGTRIALPLALVLLLAELAIALLARAIPQINVFILGLPVKILVGLAATALALPMLADGAGTVFRVLFQSAARGSAG